MKKIPMLFERDMDKTGTDRTKIYHCIDFEKYNTKAIERLKNATNVRVTIKHDGTAAKLEDGKLFVRRQVKPGKPFPNNYVLEETDPKTGKSFGWEPVEQSQYYKIVKELDYSKLPNGTYELCGPKVQPRYDFTEHKLIPHGAETLDVQIELEIPHGAETLDVQIELEHPLVTALMLYPCMYTLQHSNLEGIVFWGEIDGIDQPLVKLRVEDYQSAIQDELRLAENISKNEEKMLDK